MNEKEYARWKESYRFKTLVNGVEEHVQINEQKWKIRNNTKATKKKTKLDRKRERVRVRGSRACEMKRERMASEWQAD